MSGAPSPQGIDRPRRLRFAALTNPTPRSTCVSAVHRARWHRRSQVNRRRTERERRRNDDARAHTHFSPQQAASKHAIWLTDQSNPAINHHSTEQQQESPAGAPRSRGHQPKPRSRSTDEIEQRGKRAPRPKAKWTLAPCPPCPKGRTASSTPTHRYCCALCGGREGWMDGSIYMACCVGGVGGPSDPLTFCSMEWALHPPHATKPHPPHHAGAA